MKKIKIAGLSADPPEGMTKESVEDQTKKYVDRIGELHGILQAEKKKSVLIVLQGMDGSGKDGAVDRVFKECHPSSLNVTSFKKPTEEEFAHDFLWRVHKVAPARGAIQIFVRSHYEDVLIQRVHKWITEDRVDARFDDERELARAYDRILSIVPERVPGARIEGVFIQELVTEGAELIFGAQHNEQLGHLLMFGLGLAEARSQLAEAAVDAPDVKLMLDFIEGSQRSLVR